MPCRRTKQAKHLTARERASSTVVTCSSRQASSGPAPSRPARSRAGRRPPRGAPAPRPIKRGGRLIWALESDPVHVAPFGADPDLGPLGQGVHVRLARRVGPEPERQAGSRGVVQDRQQDRDPLEPEEGDQVPQRQGARPRTTSCTRSSKMLNPPLPGSISTVGPGAGDRGRGRRLEVRGAAAAEAAGRPRDRVLRLGSLRPDRPRGPLRPDQRRPERDRHRPVQDDRASTRTTASSSCANQSFWKSGQPYMDAITLKTLPDEQARVAALRAGAIDGATLSVDVARVARERQRPRRPEGAERRVPRAADDDQAGRDQAVARPARAAQAVNHAINRADIITAGLQRRRRVLGASSRPATARGR